MRPDLYDRAFFEGQRAGSRSSALVVLAEAFGWLGTPAGVVDVGCGVGAWLRAAVELGAGEVRGIDGEWVAPDALEVDAGLVTPLDLNAADAGALRRAAGLPGGGSFDLVLSLETAEHLAPEASAGFVEGLCALGEAVLFSAAVPHQGGHGHVNERWPGFWRGCSRGTATPASTCCAPRSGSGPTSSGGTLRTRSCSPAARRRTACATAPPPLPNRCR